MKIVLVGESNPYGPDPDMALYPMPEGCTGHRLCREVLGMDSREYLRVFDRRNLCRGDWSEAGARLVAAALAGQKFILLGARVCRAFDVDYTPLMRVNISYEPVRRALVLPHPSGLNRAWNDPSMIPRAREAVAAFCPEIDHLLGV